MIKKVVELGDGIFIGDPARQVTVDAGFPSEQLFAITNVDTAVRALEWIVEEGEGTTSGPFDPEGELAHYYRFAEIYHGRQLVADSSAPGGFSYSGAEIRFNPADVWDLPDDPKAADYPAGSEERRRVDKFNVAYSQLLRALQRTFDGEPGYMSQALADMFLVRRVARAVVETEQTIRRCGGRAYFLQFSDVLAECSHKAGVTRVPIAACDRFKVSLLLPGQSNGVRLLQLSGCEQAAPDLPRPVRGDRSCIQLPAQCT